MLINNMCQQENIRNFVLFTDKRKTRGTAIVIWKKIHIGDNYPVLGYKAKTTIHPGCEK
jgi:hypothetical protein